MGVIFWFQWKMMNFCVILKIACFMKPNGAQDVVNVLTVASIFFGVETVTTSILTIFAPIFQAEEPLFQYAMTATSAKAVKG